jgi:hypothetical protein
LLPILGCRENTINARGVMEWISIKDKFPTDLEECLVAFYVPENNGTLGYFYELSIYNCKIFHGWYPGQIIENVIYWMPIPKPPKE